MFESNPQSFSFNADILRSQATNFKSSRQQELVNLGVELDAYTQFADDLARRTQVPESQNGTVMFQLPSYKFSFSMSLPGENPAQQALVLVIHDANGNEIKQNVAVLIGGPFFPGLTTYRNFAAQSIVGLRSSIAEDERRLATLTSATPEVWSFWDFLYFSVVTQTTVGYGDILPNATSVRTLVMAQIVLGLVIITFAINVVFAIRRA